MKFDFKRATMKYEYKRAYELNKNVKVYFRNFWRLEIPKGTRCQYTAHGGFHLAARSDWIIDPELRAQASVPRSTFFKHDADHFWVWVSPDDVDAVPNPKQATKEAAL